MQFKINQAPEIVINHINEHRKTRARGTFFGTALALPTLGLSFCCFNSNEDEFSCCCFPRPLSYGADMDLKVLKKNVYFLIAKGEDINFNNEIEKNEFLKWQVDSTIKLLEDATASKSIENGYGRALSMALKEINNIKNIINSFPDAAENSSPPDAPPAYKVDDLVPDLPTGCFEQRSLLVHP